MTDKDKEYQVEAAQEQVEKVEEVATEAASTLMHALHSVEKGLEDTKGLLQQAIYRATDAESVIKLLKGQMAKLKGQLHVMNEKTEERLRQ